MVKISLEYILENCEIIVCEHGFYTRKDDGNIRLNLGGKGGVSDEDKGILDKLLSGGSEASGGGDGKPPRRGGSDLPYDNYDKEKADLVRYFSKDAVSSVLRTDQDMTYAAIGVRLLNSMGKKLDNYEVHVPADYRLELLKRAGRFCEEANVFQRIQQGGIQLFKPREGIEGGFIFRFTLSESKSKFQEGFTRDGTHYYDSFDHVHYFSRDDRLISTAKSTRIIPESLFVPIEEDGFGYTPEKLKTKKVYAYIINPRAFTGIDIEFSPETFSHLPPDNQRRRSFTQYEVATADIDPRDIKGVCEVHAEWVIENGRKKLKYELINFQKNERYISSGWELDIGMPK